MISPRTSYCWKESTLRRQDASTGRIRDSSASCDALEPDHPYLIRSRVAWGAAFAPNEPPACPVNRRFIGCCGVAPARTIEYDWLDASMFPFSTKLMKL